MAPIRLRSLPPSPNVFVPIGELPEAKAPQMTTSKITDVDGARSRARPHCSARRPLATHLIPVCLTDCCTGDGHPDIIATYIDKKTKIWLNPGGSNDFSTVTPIGIEAPDPDSTNPTTTGVVVADIDGDGASLSYPRLLPFLPRA